MSAAYQIKVVNASGVKDVIYDFQSLSIIDTLNAEGSWRLRNTDRKKCPITGSDFIVVYREGVIIYTGIVTRIIDEYVPEKDAWSWEASGTSFIWLLKSRLVFPSDVTETYYTPMSSFIGLFDDRYRVFKNTFASAIIKALLDENIVYQATPPNSHEGLEIIEGATIWSASTAQQTTVQYRFEDLYNAITPLLDAYDLGLLPVFVESTSKIRYVITSGADLTSTVIFSDKYQNIARFRKISTAPEQTRIVASYNSIDWEGETPDWVSPGTYSLWKYAGQAWAPNPNHPAGSEWRTQRRELFYRPEQDEFLTDALSPTYDFKYSKLQTIADRVAAENAMTPDGYEVEIAAAALVSYRYGCVFVPGTGFTSADYKLGDKVCIDIFGEQYYARLMQMEIEVSYGHETFTPCFGTIFKGAYRSIIGDVTKLNAKTAQNSKEEIDTLYKQGS